jgi:hypothetical protein
MTPENFVYWLQGMLEIGNPDFLDREQIEVIKDHIKLVLRKETPNRIPNRGGDIFPSSIPTMPGTWINKSDSKCINGNIGVDKVSESLQFRSDPPVDVSELVRMFGDPPGSC